jgi:hypothetical protein
MAKIILKQFFVHSSLMAITDGQKGFPTASPDPSCVVDTYFFTALNAISI